MVRSVKSAVTFPACFVAGLVLLVYLPLNLYRLSWPTASATVVTSQREWFTTTPSNGRGFPIAKIEYTYTVDGVSHTGSNYDVNGPYGKWDVFCKEAAIAEVIQTHPVGKVISIYYLKNSPDFAIIRAHNSTGEWLFMIGMNFLLGLMIRANWVAYKNGRRPWKHAKFSDPK